MIVTALAEHDEQLLMVQLARGRFAGFWLLPSVTVEDGTVEETARSMFLERTGYSVIEQRLAGVQEEPRTGMLSLRLVFATQAQELATGPSDPDIAKVRWLTREMAREVLTERDVVPTLGVMRLISAWEENLVLPLMETLDYEMPCPCGSSFSYRGCCGWDMR
ncbi:MAG: NUDIX hydrolase [Armatimonadota bacterium]